MHELFDGEVPEDMKAFLFLLTLPIEEEQIIKENKGSIIGNEDLGVFLGHGIVC